MGRSKFLLFLPTVILAGCKWTDFSSKFQSLKTKESKTSEASLVSIATEATMGPKIEGAFGWKLGDVVDDKLECVKSGVCEIKPEYRYGDMGECKVSPREAMNKDWNITICRTPSSNKIFKIVVEAGDITDPVKKGALIENLKLKYPGEDKLNAPGAPGFSYQNSGNRLFISPISFPPLIVYSSESLQDIARQEIDRAEKEKINQQQPSTSANGL